MQVIFVQRSADSGQAPRGVVTVACESGIVLRALKRATRDRELIHTRKGVDNII